MTKEQIKTSFGTNPTYGMVPDIRGYYDVILGTYNAPHENSVGKLSKAFEANLKLRCDAGALHGEFGRPSVPVGSTNQDHLQRLMVIKPDSICCKFRDIVITTDGQGVQTVTAKFKPTGKFGSNVQLMIDEGIAHLVFGHRGIARVGSGGQELTNIITWDLVDIVTPGQITKPSQEVPA